MSGWMDRGMVGRGRSRGFARVAEAKMVVILDKRTGFHTRSSRTAPYSTAQHVEQRGDLEPARMKPFGKQNNAVSDVLEIWASKFGSPRGDFLEPVTRLKMGRDGPEEIRDL